jgi:protocatechuate 3,4-dioxygenase beta subunit
MGPSIYGESKESVYLGFGQTRDDVVIEVHPAFTLSGTVKNQNGEPACAQGSVSLDSPKTDNRGHGRIGDDGTVEIWALFPATYEVSLRCQDEVPEDEYDDVEVQADVTDATWTVTTGQLLRGKVVDENGDGVEEVSVSLRQKNLKGRKSSSREWARTEADGSFLVTGLKEGTFNLLLYSQTHAAPKDPTEVTIPHKEEIVLTVNGGATVTGRVVDRDGKVVSKATVRAQGESWSWGDSATSNDNGEFRITGLRPGSYRVTANKGWFDTMLGPGQTDDDTIGTKVALRQGDTKEIEVMVAARSGSITGTVRDSQGDAVTDAFIVHQRESTATGTNASRGRRLLRWTWGKKPALTDMDGNFTLTELAPGTYTIRAYRKGGGEAWAERVAVGASTSMVLETTGVIKGTVALASGGAPARFSIIVEDKETGFKRKEKFFRTKVEFRLSEVQAGNFTVSADSPEGNSETKLELTAGATQDVTLEIKGHGTIVGRIIDLETGKPVSRMEASASVSGYVRARSSAKGQKNVSGEDGTFTIENAPAGTISVSIWPVDWQTGDYSYASAYGELAPGQTLDVGDLRVVKRRVGRTDRGGYLGITYKDSPPDIDLDKRVLEIALLAPNGPAVESGLEVGDIVVSVNGHDVTGRNNYLYHPLSRVPSGTVVEIGVKRGETFEIEAANQP